MLAQSVLAVLLYSVYFCSAEEPTSTISGAPTDVQVVAIVPTDDGQIGINPVDIPPKDY